MDNQPPHASSGSSRSFDESERLRRLKDRVGYIPLGTAGAFVPLKERAKQELARRETAKQSLKPFHKDERRQKQIEDEAAQLQKVLSQSIQETSWLDTSDEDLQRALEASRQDQRPQRRRSLSLSALDFSAFQMEGKDEAEMLAEALSRSTQELSVFDAQDDDLQRALEASRQQQWSLRYL